MLIDTYHLVQNVFHTSLCEYNKKVKKDELFFNNTGNCTFQTIKEAIELIISYRLQQTIIRIGITYKKIANYMSNSVYGWRIVENAEIF